MQARGRASSISPADGLPRTGFPGYDRFIEALAATRELPGIYPDDLTAKARKRALREVDSGYMRTAANLTREACTEWGDVYGVLGSISEALFGLPQKWQGPEPVVDALRGDANRPGLADVIIPETEAAAIMRAAIPFGVGLGRLRRIEVNGHTLRQLSAWDNEHLRYEWATDTWHVATNRGSEWRAVEDGEWVLFLPYGDKFPWKRAPWKALTLAYVLSRDAWFQRSRYAQVIAPTRVGRSSEGSIEEHREAFAAFLRNVQFDNWIVLRPGEEYDVKGISGSDNTAQVFANIIDWARRTAITTIKGETVTTDGGKGFASDETQERMSSAKMRFYARAWSRFESEIFSWAAYDLTGRHARVVRTYDTKTPADALSQIDAIDKLGKALVSLDSGLRTAGLRPSKNSISVLVRSVGVDVEDVPATSAPTVSIPFAPTDIARMVLVDEGRGSLGLGPLPDGKGQRFINTDGEPQEQGDPQPQEAP